MRRILKYAGLALPEQPKAIGKRLDVAVVAVPLEHVLAGESRATAESAEWRASHAPSQD
jgi:hypothetical protein